LDLVLGLGWGKFRRIIDDHNLGLITQLIIHDQFLETIITQLIIHDQFLLSETSDGDDLRSPQFRFLNDLNDSILFINNIDILNIILIDCVYGFLFVLY